MRRRQFLRTTGTLAALSGALPSLAFREADQKLPNELQNYLLRGFEDEQEEYPSLVSNGSGDMWNFSLRRLPYPSDKELVSAFRYREENWEEISPVTREEGQYEAPAADCAEGGYPVVAWCSIHADQWNIQAAAYEYDRPQAIHQFSTDHGRSINPVVLAPSPGKCWIAWENYFEGRFSIFLSKYEEGSWCKPVEINKGENSCFDPAIAEDQHGNLYVAYGLSDGFHQNVEMSILDGQSLEVVEQVPVATGGAFKNRVNLNTKPALAFDSKNRLWISFENNRNATRLDDADCYTGDRCCAMLSYEDGKIVEPAGRGKWLFTSKNDHRPTFVKDQNGNLFAVTHCGGDFQGNPFWQYRVSWLDPSGGWAEPVTILQTKQKGVLIPPAIAFDEQNNFWLSTLTEGNFEHEVPEEHGGVVQSRLTQLRLIQFQSPQFSTQHKPLEFTESVVEEYHENRDFIPEISGHPKISGEELTANGTSYSLIYGNLHEHSENSPCWSAGTDGTLHEDYRFGLFSEGYQFVGITDHGYSLNEVYWRKNLRLADFYNDPPYFVAIPAMEWTLTARGDLESVPGCGHYNVVFASPDEARKFIRNSQEVFNVNTPESSNSKLLWELLHEKNIDCITIPHHPADKSHPVDWNLHDPHFVPVVELFQCRGNGEYPGCPREVNLERHSTTSSRRAFVDYALRDKKYKMGFVASGDHNGMGVGVAALWVKEYSREGILEAMREKRCFATTGDKMILDFRVNGTLSGSTLKSDHTPQLEMSVVGQRSLEKVEVLRNSRVIQTYSLSGEERKFENVYSDKAEDVENDVLYYYIRATQKNGEIAWSSPVWVEKT